MKNYLITEKQFKKIVEQVEDSEETKNSSSIFGNLLGNEDVEMDSEDDELSGGDPVQQFFNSLK